MIGSLIGLAASAAGSIFGGIKASKAAKAARESTLARKRANDNWFARRYNEDATQRADAQRVLTLTRENIRNRNKAALGRQAVMGGTEESVAAERAENNQALAEAASRIAAAADARKDGLEQQYLERNERYEDALANMEQNRAAAVTNAISGVVKSSANVGDAIDGIVPSKFGGDVDKDDKVDDEDDKVKDSF